MASGCFPLAFWLLASLVKTSFGRALPSRSLHRCCLLLVMAHRLLSDPDADGWERSDFPIVCETCLGPNPYVRMQRVSTDGSTLVSCDRPSVEYTRNSLPCADGVWRGVPHLWETVHCIPVASWQRRKVRASSYQCLSLSSRRAPGSWYLGMQCSSFALCLTEKKQHMQTTRTADRYKKTIVCQEVAKAKNVCQVSPPPLVHGLAVLVTFL